MDKNAMKKVLAGLSIAGLVTSVTLTGCQKANGSCGAGSCSKTEKVEGEDAAKGTGSCSGMEDTSAHGTGSCAGMKDGKAAGESSNE
ncbi:MULTISPECIES: SbtA family thio(seleno)oxazole RiPP natural product precursor [unclassified Prosthecochloris]|uniref:SbtA family thio(seleno)oxazole RiPP natural product precursor n=1 Tax=unclassified Prosthecochloris TaxID=2632826 RepID=UPI00223CEA7A|nr:MULTISPECIES: SbtA family thio(seleno)oxazole RiPP natural product precursor [unclassified Prosthecochloris]UZJ38610.1 SbtA family thio(seleno)oxazole RiPP natural product precursor [Prosthecochloris sp. SCSIO W1103]